MSGVEPHSLIRKILEPVGDIFLAAADGKQCSCCCSWRNILTIWWDRLKKALGTASSDFVDGSLWQLQAAAKLPYTGNSETAMNAALAMIEATAPRDEIEAEGALFVVRLGIV